MKTPRWALAKVKELARSGRIQLTRKATDEFHNRATATAAAVILIGGMTNADYVGPQELKFDDADVYAFNIGGAGWYLKITIEEPMLLVISLHPLDRPITTNKGKVKP